MNRIFLSLVLLSLIAFSCNQTKNTATDTEATTETMTSEEEANETFGAAFEASEVVGFDDLYAEVTDQDSMNVQVQGTVESVCQAKGCWMNIVSTETENAEMMVKFKDYGFIMHKDIAGRQVIMNGVVYYETTPVDELRHYAEDAGKSEEEIAAITEPKRELKFLADGVILLDK